MATPTQERPKVLIPLPPLPEFYQITTEGNAMPLSSSSPSSHAKKAAKSRKSTTKVLAAVEVRSKSKHRADPHSHATPPLPPAKPPSPETLVDAQPAFIHSHSPPPPPHPVKLLAYPPPPPPPGFVLDGQEEMAHRYSYRHHHEYRQPVQEVKTQKISQTQPARIITIPPPPPGFPGTWVEAEPAAQTTITVCHVCRICLRPRSEKYHQEHPIPKGSIPPPPGICKRCRITSVEERIDHAEVVHVEESNNVKLGISAFLPKDNQYTQREASEAINKQHRRGYGDIYVRENSSDEDVPQRVVYRHVKQTKKFVPAPPPEHHAEVSVENLAAMNLMNDRPSPRHETGRTTMKVNVGSDYLSPESGTIQCPPHAARVAEIRKVERPETNTSSSSTKSSKTGKDTANNDGKGNAKVLVSVNSKTSAASSQSNVKAKVQATVPAAPGFTESEIRTFARDEVERYRQAERMMAAHPNAYAHGKLVPVTSTVPVERRIETVRDEAPHMPWEVLPSPARETTFATLRPRTMSSASKDGPGRIERVPTEDSRHWYRPFDSAPSTKSASSKESTATIQPPATRPAGIHGSRGAYEYERKVIYERQRSSTPSQGLPESDAPANVEFKEVVGVVREEPTIRSQPARSRRGYEQDIIEVSEEIELPPGGTLRSASSRANDPAISQHIRIIRTANDIEQRQRPSQRSQEGQDSRETREASVWTDRSYRRDDGVVKTASGLSSISRDRDNGSRISGSERRSEGKPAAAIEVTEEMYSMPSPRQFVTKPSSHGRSDDASWYDSRVKTVRTHQQASEHPSVARKSQVDDDDKTTWHPDEAPVRPAASSRVSPTNENADDDDWDWEYRKRIITASDRPPGRRDDESAPGRHYVDTERLFRRRRPSESNTREANPPLHNDHTQSTETARPPQYRVYVTPAEVDQDPPEDRGREPYVRTSDESAHVRFASKVEFSPTPPGSDEPLPEQAIQGKSSRPLKKGPLKGSGLRNQIDGGASEPSESAEPLRSGYKTTSSFRGHSIERQEDLDYVSAKYASSARGSARSGSAAQQSFRSDPRSFRSEESRRSTRTTREGNDSAKGAPTDEEDRRSRQSTRYSTQGDDETATQLSRSRRLARALSESPSRERFQQDYVYMEKQREERSETVISRGRQSDVSEPKEDGKGPYREDTPRTESMDALYGSGHGAPKKRQQEYVVRGEW